MVSVVPFLPSFRWYAVWLRERRNGKPEDLARGTANSETGITGKDFARAKIRGCSGATLLPIPIVGGSATLKRQRMIPSALLSDHGNWRHIHLATIETIYGRYPFSGEILALLRDVYASSETTLSAFNTRIHETVASIIPPPAIIRGHLPTMVIDRGREILENIDADLSILDALMRYGPETTLSLIAFDIK